MSRIKIGLIQNFNENFDERDWNFNVGVPCNEYTQPEAIQYVVYTIHTTQPQSTVVFVYPGDGQAGAMEAMH